MHLIRRNLLFLCWIISSLLVGSHATLGDEEQSSDWEGVHLANYVHAEDLPTLRELGINTVLMELERNENHWEAAYKAVVKNHMKVVPVLWGNNQAIWKWNKKRAEWELDITRYPMSTGARFIAFLHKNAEYREHTFAMYSFHEPWYIPDTGKRKGSVNPLRLRKFWTQIKELFSSKMKVYGEEVTWAPECKNGCVDYDYVTLYSFIKSEGEPAYRPGGRFQVGSFGLDGGHGPAENDPAKAMLLERKQITLMHRLINEAPAAPDGTKTKLIALMGTFAHDTEPDLWNRMPSAVEMKAWCDEIVQPCQSKLAGLGWYAFRNPTDYYEHVLRNSRKDDVGDDRWDAIRSVSKSLFKSP